MILLYPSLFVFSFEFIKPEIHLMKLLAGYDRVAKSLHWLMAILVLSLLAVGMYMHELPKTDEWRPVLYMLHKSFGVMVLLLFILRVSWRMTHKPPEMAEVFSSKWSPKFKKIAALNHRLLYLLMALVPLMGLIMSTAAGYPVNFLNLFTVPY